MRRIAAYCLGSVAFTGLTLALAPVSRAAPPMSQPRAPASGEADSKSEVIEPPLNSCNKQPSTAKFHITLSRDAELRDLVSWMSSVSCQKFIWNPAVRGGKVTIVSPEPVTLKQAYEAFYAALDSMNLTVERAGEYYKLVETQSVVDKNLPVYGPGRRAPGDDRYVTQLYRPQPDRIAQVVEVAEHLKGERGTVKAVGELVILTDTGANVRRVMQVIEEVDEVGEADSIFLHPLEYADPEEVRSILTEVFGMPTTTGGTASLTRQSASSGSRRGKAKSTAKVELPSPTAAADVKISQISVDTRTRTLIIAAPREGYAVVRRLVERLDVALPEDSGKLHVIRLQHADPQEVATVLGSLPTASKGGASSAGKGRTAPQSAGVSLSGDIHVTADPATRALVVMSSHADFLAVQRVVEQLDIDRKQVYIEAYIMELSASSNRDVGAGGHFARQNSDGSVGVISSNPGDTSSLALNPSVLTGLAAGLLGPTIPGSAAFFPALGQDIPSFGVVLQALETSEDINIISEPHLYTSDNKVAKMKVGQVIPVPTGTNSFNNGGVPVTQTQYSREDVSLSLEVTPHINDNKEVTLDVKIENEEVLPTQSEGGPTTSKRELELEAVVARDGQPVVLGGLVYEKETIADRKVPGLGSIPVLGWLFKNRNKTRSKVNLLVILVPHVLETPDDMRRIHMRRLAERRDFLEHATAFKRRDLTMHVNYRKKSGLLATVNAEAIRMEGEAQMREQAEVELGRSVAQQIAPDGSWELLAAEPKAAP